MLDIGKSELLVIIIVTLVVMGPKELPRVLRYIFGLLRKVRGFASDFQSQMEDLAKEADLEDIHKAVTSAQNSAGQEKLLSALGVDDQLQSELKSSANDMDQTVEQIRHEGTAKVQSLDNIPSTWEKTDEVNQDEDGLPTFMTKSSYADLGTKIENKSTHSSQSVTVLPDQENDNTQQDNLVVNKTPMAPPHSIMSITKTNKDTTTLAKDHNQD